MENEAVKIVANSVPVTKDVSEANRKQLLKVCTDSGYTNVRFWIPPNSTSSADECTAEVVQALQKFKEAKAKGLKPDDNEPC
jgi:hypothetical protein